MNFFTLDALIGLAFLHWCMKYYVLTAIAWQLQAKPALVLQQHCFMPSWQKLKYQPTLRARLFYASGFSHINAMLVQDRICEATLCIQLCC